jgi:hypothetical protein
MRSRSRWSCLHVGGGTAIEVDDGNGEQGHCEEGSHYGAADVGGGPSAFVEGDFVGV